MGAFTDKVAIVTGGASGIGRALGEALARSGARVVLADRDAELVARAGEEIGAETAVLDVRDAEAVKALVEGTARAHGRLDYLFNNAGIAVLGDARDVSLEDWRNVIDVDLYGVVHGVVAAYPIMIEQGSGHIVNTASAAGLIPAPGEVSYNAAKYGVVGLSHALRAEAEDLGVKVSVACPGFIETPIFQTSKVVNLDRARLLARTPKAMSPDRCAQEILRGVERNQATIVVTTLGKVAWRLHRYVPWVVTWLLRRGVRQMREVRGGP
jgi:NADP-dependent 3-hydroxy acid dehydrogenase YdfG